MKNEPRSNFFEDRADESRPSSCGELTKIFNSVPQLLWSCGPDGQVDVLSEQWRAYFACEPADLKGQGWIRFLHPDDLENTVRRWQFSIETGHHLRMQYRMRCSTGDYRWFLAKATPECDPAGKVERWYGCCTDIHDHVVAQQELLRSEAVYRSILEASVDSIKMLGLDGRIQMMNRSAVDSMNYDHAESLAGVEFQSLWPPEARPSIEQALASAQSGEAGRFTAFRPAPSGERKCWDVVITPVIDSIGEVTRLLAISRDVTAERMRSQELLWASEHDPLTGLPNRRAFQAHLKAAVFRAMKSGEKLGLLMIDLDHFKHVNDTLGHPTGDALLRAVSRRLQKVVRADDFVARMGGDEFAVIVENLAGDDVLLRISQSLQASVGMPVRIRERAITCGASIGGAIYPDDATNANDLFKLADTALYNLKAAGRGGTKLFQSGMLEEAERAASQLSVARIALQDSTVLPYFQPKIRLSDNSICGFEALLRWTHPDLGLQLPGTVEEAFKDYELAAKIGDLMQRKVVDSIHGWRRQGVAFGRISINAAPVEFLRDDYSERLLALLERRQIPADLLEIEVTEHALLDSSGRFVGRALDRLKNAGLTIALDDFGTGSSSLSHLRDFPVDVVKIDQSFVQNMAADREIAAIVSAVIGLAHSLGMETVAEGVETPDQLRMLGEFGCHVAQGYLFGRPMPAAGAGAICEARQAA